MAKEKSSATAAQKSAAGRHIPFERGGIVVRRTDGRYDGPLLHIPS